LVVAGVLAIEGCATMAEPVPEPPADPAHTERTVEYHASRPGFCPEPVHAPVAKYNVDSLIDQRSLVVTRKVPPSYPDAARKAGVDGLVAVAALVCEHGRVVEMRMAKSIPLLDDAAMACVQHWLFEPIVVNGTPVSTWVYVPVRFSLR